jgi:hypothetical protein
MRHEITSRVVDSRTLDAPRFDRKYVTASIAAGRPSTSSASCACDRNSRKFAVPGVDRDTNSPSISASLCVRARCTTSRIVDERALIAACAPTIAITATTSSGSNAVFMFLCLGPLRRKQKKIENTT